MSMSRCQAVLNNVFGKAHRVEELISGQNTTHNDSPTYSTNHEYVEVYARCLSAVEGQPSMFREPKPGCTEINELVAQINPDFPTIAEIEARLAKLMSEHLVAFKEELEAQGLMYNEETNKLDPWKGIYNYKRAEYRDTHGSFVPEEFRKDKQASIWV